MAKGYSDVLDTMLSDDGLLLLKSYARDGYTYRDIADRFGISPHTLDRWREKFPQIEEAIKEGRELTDYKVENALLKCALGYKTKEVKTTTIMKFGKVVETQKEVLEKEQPPSVQAITLWLTNRNKDKWKTPNSKSLLDEVEEDSTIQVTVTRAGKHEVDGEDGDVVNESIELKKGEKSDSKSNEDWEEEEAIEWADDDLSSDAEWAAAIAEVEEED